MNAAGTTLIDKAADFKVQREALAVVNNWRAAHGWPLEALQRLLRERAATLGDEALLAQRLKRLTSIEAKLRRTPKMQLARMQDVGGCRVVLPTAEAVKTLAGQGDQCGTGHELLRHYDYLAEPRASGYRGVHLVFAYRPTDAQDAAYAGMRIEMQLRSRLQHSWATAVETVDTFSGLALKSSFGSAQWLRLFALMGSRMAEEEGLPPVPGTPADPAELRRELVNLAADLEAERRLMAYSDVVRVLPRRDVAHARYFIIYVDDKDQSPPRDPDVEPTPDSMEGRGAHVRWEEYTQDQRSAAIQAYEELEEFQRYNGGETVLVRVESVNALRGAYPNYFADTSVFLGELQKAIG